MDVVLNPARKNLEEAILSWIDLQEGSGELPRVFVFTNPEGNRTFCPTLPKREFTITYAIRSRLRSYAVLFRSFPC